MITFSYSTSNTNLFIRTAFTRLPLKATVTVQSCECLGAGHASLSRPASAISASESSSLFSVEPTSILPFLFLGSQTDALSSDVINKHGIEYVVNVSAACPQSPFVAESNFLRIPVNDGHEDRLLPFFSDVFQFIDSVRESSGRVLVHCLAGISRSPTIVIAYVMHHLRLSIDDAYRYVKNRRPSISPNFNFLGQLVEFDTHLTQQRAIDSSASSTLTPQTPESSVVTQMKIEVPERAPSPSKRPCMVNLSHAVQSRRSLAQCADGVTVQSPTTALSRLQFVEQRQTSSTAAVKVVPKSTMADVLITQSPPAFQSKPSTVHDTSIGVVQQHEQPVASSSSSSSSVSLSQQTTSTTRGGETLAVNIDTQHAAELNSASKTADMLLVDWQTSFKSRSLEDILLVSTSPPRSLSHGQGLVTSHWTPADKSHDEPRLTGHASLTTSHGSLSTGHGSLHGSLEMIQVS